MMTPIHMQIKILSYDNSNIHSTIYINDLHHLYTHIYVIYLYYIYIYILYKDDHGNIRYCYNFYHPNQKVPFVLIRFMKVSQNGILVPRNIEEWTSVHNAADAQVALQG